MKKKTKPNIRLLRRIQRAILKKANQFQMCSLFSGTLDNDKRAGGCGTSGCIAGWAIHLTSGNKRLDETRPVSTSHVTSIIKRAGRLIGIPTKEARIPWLHTVHPLFFYDQWPEPYKSNYSKAMLTEATAKRMARIASDRIEHFIKTGK